MSCLAATPGARADGGEQPSVLAAGPVAPGLADESGRAKSSPADAVSASTQTPEACAPTEWIDIPTSLAPLVARRRAKCAELKPYQQGFAEKQLLLIEKADRPPIGQVNLFGFYPRLQTMDHRSRIAIGTRFWRQDVFGSAVDVAGAYFVSRSAFQYAEAQVGVLPHRGREFPRFAFKGDEVFEIVNVRSDDNQPYTLYGSWMWRWSPQYDFFGAGPDSSRDDRADFRQKDQLVEAVAGLRLAKHLSLMGRAGWWWVSTGPGTDDALPNVDEVFAPAQIPGYGERLEYLRCGASLVFDARDVRDNPHSGGVAAVQYTRYDQRNGDAYSFGRISADARAYIPLGHPQRVLALRAYLTRDDPAADGRSPFFTLAFIGSGRTLRGYPSQRFRGERVASAQAEYRIDVAPALEIALFYDGGAVALVGDESVSHWRSSGGVGLRLKTHEAVFARTDFAWGSEGFRFLLRFSPGF